jgi:hypothetical protein
MYVGAALDHNGEIRMDPLLERPDQREFVGRVVRQLAPFLVELRRFELLTFCLQPRIF